MNKFYFSASTILASLLFTFISCSEVGKQPPENITLASTPDGAKIVRLYSVLFVYSYKKVGNSVHRSGTSTNYIELYDASNGNPINKEPYELNGYYQIMKTTQNHLWLKRYNTDTQKQEIFVLNIPNFSKAFSSDDLEKINNGLGFLPNQTYLNPYNKNTITIQGDDARIYQINETSGKATLLPDSVRPNPFDEPYLKLSAFETVGHRYRFDGANRKKLLAIPKTSNPNKTNISTYEDFIDPFIIAQFQDMANPEVPLILNNGYLLISKTKKNQTYQNQFSLIDTASLKTIWTCTLPNDPTTSLNEELLDLKPSGKNLLALTKSFMGLIDPQSGKWIWTKSFASKKE